MAQESNKNVIWTIVVGIILALILLGGFMTLNGKVNDATSKIPTASELANKIVVPQAPAAPSINVPSAEEIAAQIDMPETDYSVRQDKINVAKSLCLEELNTRDLKTTLASRISLNTPANDLSRSDIKDISVRDTEVSSAPYFYSSSATIKMVVKVYFNDYGDEEWAKYPITCYVNGLNYDDGYEDADVSSISVGSLISDSY